jgi:hypothetical protein
MQGGADCRMAPQVGLEPTTLRLTAGCSAIELLRSVFGARPEGAASFFVIHNIIGGGCGDFKVARDSAQLWGGTARDFAAACFCGGSYVCRTIRYVHA